MDKVDEKWLKEHGWECFNDDVIVEQETSFSKTIKHHTTYYKRVGSNRDMRTYKRARWDHTYERYYLIGKKTGKERLQSTSNYYIFSSFGDGFEVDNKISHRKFPAEKVEAALKLCGIE